MNSKPTQAVLIQHALAAIERVLAHDDNAAPVPFFGPTDLGELPIEKQALLQRLEQQHYRERPAYCALHFCLVSASALLGVSQTLLDRQVAPSPADREREWNALANHAKIAGRSAYRAALILADPPQGDAGLS